MYVSWCTMDSSKFDWKKNVKNRIKRYQFSFKYFFNTTILSAYVIRSVSQD